MILFRADANEEIGTGHIMRCLSIAHAFKAQGEDVLFVTANQKGEQIIKNNGFKSLCLNIPCDDLENDKTEAIVSMHAPRLVIVDTYFVTESFLHSLNSIVPVLYIDDLNVACWDVDFLLNYNIFASVYDYASYKIKKTKLLLDVGYAPLRAEFRALPRHTIKDHISDVLVSAGGSDPQSITETIATNLCRKHKEINFHFIVGELNPRLEQIKAYAKGQSNVILHVREKKMSSLMCRCDMAISASGSTLYELCAAGTPTITFSLADNQIIAAEVFEKKGIMLNAGDCRESPRFFEDLDNLFCLLESSSEIRENMSIKMQSLVDGKGSERIVRNFRE